MRFEHNFCRVGPMKSFYLCVDCHDPLYQVYLTVEGVSIINKFYCGNKECERYGLETCIGFSHGQTQELYYQGIGI